MAVASLPPPGSSFNEKMLTQRAKIKPQSASGVRPWLANARIPGRVPESPWLRIPLNPGQSVYLSSGR